MDASDRTLERIRALIVTYGRPEQLRRCLLSLAAAEARVRGALVVEKTVLIAGEDPASVSVLSELKVDSVISHKRLNPSEARNRLLDRLEVTPCDWILFVDDDAYVPEDYFVHLTEAHRLVPDAAAIGGPNLTPPGSNVFQRATGEVLACRLANFLSTARYRAKGQVRDSGEEELILCNLFVRSSAIHGLRFPEKYICAEENRLLQSMRALGARLTHAPSLVVYHERREGPGALAAQVFKYGTGRGQNLRDDPRSFRAAYVAPSLALLTGVVLGAHTILGDVASRWDLALLTVLYGIAILAASVRIWGWLPREERRISFFLWCLLIFPIIHFAYAAGVLRGMAMPDSESSKAIDAAHSRGMPSFLL